MKKSLYSTFLFAASVATLGLNSCDKNEGSTNPDISGADSTNRQFITLSAAFPDAEGEAGNGGTKVFSITPEQAIDPNYEVKIFENGYSVRSQRTARIQSSKNGNFIYNIQYTGNDGGIFNKYSVKGGANFVDTREEVNTEPILGTSPRWMLAAEGIGVGVYASSKVEASAPGAGADFIDVVSTAKIAILNLDNPQITRQNDNMIIPFTSQQTQDGYQIGRIDVPILNANKDKIFIGCNLTRIDKTKPSGVNDAGNQTWTNGTRQLGTATLVVDYPTLTNPRLIYSSQSKVNNHSYRTMTQYLDEQGYIYQATATSGSQILRINGTTATYDDNYNFDLKTALGKSNNLSIRAWKYIKDGIGVVLYTESGVDGGYIAMIDLNTKTATKITTENETNIGFSGRSANASTGVQAIVGTFGQFQNLTVIGDNIYIPMTPNGVDGNLYVINYKNNTVIKGAKLKNQSGSFYIGAY